MVDEVSVIQGFCDVIIIWNEVHTFIPEYLVSFSLVIIFSLYSFFVIFYDIIFEVIKCVFWFAYSIFGPFFHSRPWISLALPIHVQRVFTSV
jgi:hypothetical protein